MIRHISRIGGRKFVMTMGCGIVCTGLVIAKVITGGEFVAIILGTIGAYITGNAADTYLTKSESNSESL